MAGSDKLTLATRLWQHAYRHQMAGDLDRAIEELRSKGMKFVSEVDEGEHVRLIDFEDPDGNRLQLFEFKKSREH